MNAVLISLLLQINAATPNPTPPPMVSADSNMVREMMYRQMEDQKYRPKKTIAEQWEEQNAIVEERVFVNRFNDFLKKMQLFIDGYNTGKVDLKTVQEVQKAWSKVEKNGWFKKSAQNRK